MTCKNGICFCTGACNLNGIPHGQMDAWVGKSKRAYKLHFEPDGFCSYYPSDDDTGWDLEEVIEMVKEYNRELGSSRK